MTNATIMWTLFGAVVLVMLLLDLKLFHRKAHEIRLGEAVLWSLIWVALSLAFALGVSLELGQDHAMKFLTGYLIEKALSMDNLFVFLIIFSYFGVPLEYQHKVLFWGILGALLFRALFIAAGVALIGMFAWTIYVLGAFLVFTGIKLAFASDHEFNPERNLGIRLFRKIYPVTTEYSGDHFFTMHNGVRAATPLFIALIVIETTDIVFATDSIPAILGITTDPFLVYSSNIFAILGLRALYFVLAGIMRMFRFLHYGLSLILVFVGVKMLAGEWLHLSVTVELSIVFGILLGSVLASLVFKEKKAVSSEEDGTAPPR